MIDDDDNDDDNDDEDDDDDDDDDDNDWWCTSDSTSTSNSLELPKLQMIVQHGTMIFHIQNKNLKCGQIHVKLKRFCERWLWRKGQIRASLGPRVCVYNYYYTV